MAFREVDQLFEHMAVTAELEGDLSTVHEIQKLITEKASQKVAVVQEIADEQQTEPHYIEYEVLSAPPEFMYKFLSVPFEPLSDYDDRCERTFEESLVSTGTYQDKDEAERVKADLQERWYFVKIREHHRSKVR